MNPTAIPGDFRYSYIGPTRVERIRYPGDIRTDFFYDGVTGVANPLDDFGVKQVRKTTTATHNGTTIIDDRTYKWNEVGSKTQRKDERVGGPRLTHDYTYDDGERLAHTHVTGPPPTSTVIRDTDYTLDGVHNRIEVFGNPDPGEYVGFYSMTDGDCPVNQYTSTPFDSRCYDENGNLVSKGDLVCPSDLKPPTLGGKDLCYIESTTGAPCSRKTD
jgi:hypothetical protein